ncbi:glycosyltransferase family 2 protein, partial [Phenylobacterium sp.]|uniref:glycosyltransferase family 2 protein n=1 Tax=Phenylobacterium sp. TaxID=1871053 RepID=UPI00273692D5
RFEPYFKTDWNAELLLSHNMVSHLGVYRRSLVEQVGGLREGFEGSQDYDLALRVAELTEPARILHIPAVLYHWRQQSEIGSFSEQAIERCAVAGRRAVEEHLQRTGETSAHVEIEPNAPAWVHVRRDCPSPEPLVSVIVPTRDRAELLENCVEGLLNRTDYPAIELLIVDNGSVEPATHALFERLQQDPRVRILPQPGPFNYSALNNAAAAQARGDILLLLNNDIEVIEPGWLREMVAHAVRPHVGAVGARLLYGDGRVQHGGVILGVGGTPPVAGHLYVGAPRADTGYFGHLRLTRNVSAVTAACMALRREVFEEVGGLDAENLAVAFNDVDLCLKIRERGYSIVWTPRAELFHLESASRGLDTRPEQAERFRREVMYMRGRWGAALDDDPFYGPNFDRMHGDYRLAETPNRARPWAGAA